MSTWAAILVGVGAGVLSGVVGTLLTITHQRGAEMRTRMLVAAEHLLTTAEAGRKAVRVARGNLNEQTYNDVRDVIDDLYPAVTLISLLYGYTSKASLRAQGIGSSFVDVRGEMVKGANADDAVIQSEMEDLADHIIVFGEVAADQVRRGWFRRTFKPVKSGIPAIPKEW